MTPAVMPPASPGDGCWALRWSDRARDYVRCGADPTDRRDVCDRHATDLDHREAS